MTTGSASLHGQCKVAFRGDFLFVAAPYHPAFVAALKAKIQPRRRRWIAPDKLWRIGPLTPTPGLDEALYRILDENFEAISWCAYDELTKERVP